ncbi:MAG: riboflavin synthase [Ginsengibacter sp.]
MFTGIIENMGTIKAITKNGENITYVIDSQLTDQLNVDESISQNGVCLTIENISKSEYWVTAVKETILKTNAKYWKVGSIINLERAMMMNGRLDGHIVQGHVDDVCKCIEKKDLNGSWEFQFEFDPQFAGLIIEKGSVCLNGVSLTTYNVNENQFTVSIIPYTFDHTNFNSLLVGDYLNIEFDILGKYVQRMLSLRK